jgi:hypothetical protein
MLKRNPCLYAVKNAGHERHTQKQGIKVKFHIFSGFHSRLFEISLAMLYGQADIKSTQ